MDKDRAELKREYKNRPKNMGVYQIRNLVNGKIFVESSPNLDGMLNRFKMATKYDGDFKPNNRELTREIKEYGPDNFVYEVLDQLKPMEDPLYNYSEDLKTLEELWLEKLQPYEGKGYNQRKRR